MADTDLATPFITEDFIESRTRTVFVGTYQKLGLDAQGMEHCDLGP